MPSPIEVEEFIQRWEKSELGEQQAAQSHFIDLCRLLNQQPPAESDPEGNFFTFEKQVIKADGKPGRADVWFKGHFAWEYKGKAKDLNAAYAQLQSYRGDLGNPPLLVVCDFLEYRIYPQWTDMDGQPFVFRNADLIKVENQNFLRWLFEDPEKFRQLRDLEWARRSELTEQLAQKFADLASMMRDYHADGNPEAAPAWTPLQVAHFLTRLTFILFAQSIGLLPKHEGTPVFTYLVTRAKNDPELFVEYLSTLFGAMAGTEVSLLYERIPYFNGGLFNDAEVLDIMALRLEGVQLILEDVCAADWSRVNPTITGTLFEGALDMSKRSQLGAHYTSEADIRLIVEPVLMQPLYREWETIRTEAEPLLQRFLAGDTAPRQKGILREQLTALHDQMMSRLGSIRVLDPACGSGNFLYVSLRVLKDLEAQVRLTFEALDLSFQDVVTPRQLFGIEKDEFAAQLAQVVVWIGYLQWRYEYTGYLRVTDIGVRNPDEIKTPILLDKLPDEPDHILNADAILSYDENGTPFEPIWPTVDVIIGNPPFLGGKRLRSEMPKGYVDRIFALYEDKVPHEADLVCYWFEKARRQLEHGKAKRAGLLATNSIRGGANRVVLDRIKETGDIFMAWSDREWVLEGANVRISVVGFDDRSETEYVLDGAPVLHINADLQNTIDATKARNLAINHDIAFMGVTPAGPFDLDEVQAQNMLAAVNTNGRSNADVVRPYLNAMDLVRQTRNQWTIDFGVSMDESEAAQYELPFDYIKQKVKPIRELNNRQVYRERWWLYAEPRPLLRKLVNPLERYIATAILAKHRLFVWLTPDTLCSNSIIVIARDDDYFFGVLHSYLHDIWAVRLGTSLGPTPRYTPTTTFETFPFPWSPGKEPIDDPGLTAIAEAAKILHEVRDEWLNPAEDVGAAQLRLRTLTSLYNEVESFRESRRENQPFTTNSTKPATLIAEQIAVLHDTLDAAVLAAYGWSDLVGQLRTETGDEELLRRLLALNLERATQNM